MTRDVAPGMKICPYCAEEVRAEAVKCRYCGERLELMPTPPVAAHAPPPRPAPMEDPFEPVQPPPRPAAAAAEPTPEPPAFGARLGELPASIYKFEFDLDTLPKGTRQAAAQHSLNRQVPVWVAVAASILTCNFFFVFNYSVKHGRLPKLTSNDPSGPMAALLLLVPIFNLYWIFFCWVRLSDRLNFQLKLRDMPPGPNRWLPVFGFILVLLGYLASAASPDFWVFAFALNWLVILPLFVSQLQGAINDLILADQRP